MKQSIFSVLAGCLACALWGLPAASFGADRVEAAEKPSPFAWVEEPGKSFALSKNGNILWQIHFDAKEGKPYIHPLRTAGGKDLTWHRPEDHPWHLGLWFSWKLINGLNYWETNRATGLCQGTTAIRDVKIEKKPGNSAVISIALDYHPPGQPALLTEARTITITPPAADGSYRIGWHAVFTAGGTKVLLDRTKPSSQGGPPWGGYAGLTYRSLKTMTQREALDSTGWKNTGKIMGSGRPANWIDLSGQVDADGGTAGVAILDHPLSWRHPSPWYVYMDGTFGAIKTAPIYHEPVTLEPGQKITLSYLVLVHDGRGDAARINAEYERFSKEKMP